ncbi:MAG: N-acetylneuraminate synthase family protein [Candidatus Omnitrophica bacterium]|nr:N-acetylneuraminate synthase family protein [Candidatus Omnitrophota bacterium]
MKVISIGAKKIGDGHPCFILAEAGCNHNGNLGIARQLIDSAVAARADAVKFQTYKADRLYSKKTPMMAHFRATMKAGPDATMYDLIKATELAWEYHAPLVEYSKKKGIMFLSTPFDEKAVDYLEKYNVPAYKIASFEMTHFPLIRKAARTGKPVILSTGMSTLGDIEKALSVIRAEGNDRVILLHCVSNYPAKPEDCNLRVIQTLKSAFGYPVGISDHTPGIEVPKIAVAIGANLIEKHITVDRSLPGPDHYFSLTPDDLKSLVKASRNVEAMLGSPYKRCTEAEEPMKKIGRRSLVAAKDIPAGAKVTPTMLAVKRPGYGLPTELSDILIGSRTTRDIEEDEPLSWNMFLDYGPVHKRSRHAA